MEKIYFSATENTTCLSNVCEHKIPCKASGRMKNGRNHGETGEKSEKRRRGSIHCSDGTEQAAVSYTHLTLPTILRV